MDCNQSRRLLDAYVDGELDPAHHLDVESHLGSCPACAHAVENLEAGRRLMRSALPRYAAPSDLEDRLRASVAEAARLPWPTPTADQNPAPSAPIIFHPVFWKFAGMAASLALVLAVGYHWGGARERGRQLTDEAVGEHLRSLMPGHLMDVVSTDRHTVKPWFAGKLSFSPPVVDLAPLGFPLLGGRLDQVGRERAAALIYGRRAHSINLFIWRAEAGALPSLRRRDSGCQVEGWSAGGLNYLAVSDIPAEDLAQFCAAIRAPQP